MSEKVTGTIIVLNEVVQVSDKFAKRELVIQTEDQYPQTIPVQFTQDKCDMLNNSKVGDRVEVSVNLGGRKWTSPDGVDKYFLSLTGWKIEKSGEPQAAIAPEGEEDSLPF